VAEASDGNLMGYMLGKAEGEGKLWHGHVSAVTVAPQYRRLGLAKVGYSNAPKIRCVSLNRPQVLTQLPTWIDSHNSTTTQWLMSPKDFDGRS
jgi:hypothetical protein